MEYKYYTVYDEEADGWDLYVYSTFYHQTMWFGIFDSEEDAIQAYLDFIAKS